LLYLSAVRQAANRAEAGSCSGGRMTVLEIDDGSCLAGSNGGEQPSSVQGVQALNSLGDREKGVVLDLAVVDLDCRNVVGRQHSSVKDQEDAVRPALGPSCGALAFGEVLVPGPFPVDNQERAGFGDETDLLLDLASSRVARWLIRLRYTAWPTPRVGSVGMSQDEQAALGVEEHSTGALQLGGERPLVRNWFLFFYVTHRREGIGQRIGRRRLGPVLAADVELGGPEGLAYTGLRWGEAVALRVRDVDLARRRLDVRRAFVDLGGQLVEGKPKTHQSRTVPLPEALCDELHALVADLDRDALVFTAPEGGPLRAGNFRQRVWTSAVRAAGLDLFTIHGLRHTAASLYISACTPPKVVQRILGHASVVMTMDLYGHLYPDEMDTLAARLNEVASESGVWPERGQIAGSEPEGSEEDR
jgi:hypothetical protein